MSAKNVEASLLATLRRERGPNKVHPLFRYESYHDVSYDGVTQVLMNLRFATLVSYLTAP